MSEDTSRHPQEVEQSALEVNTVDATEGQKLQAAQEIDNDPAVADEPAAEPELSVYDDEEAWPYRKLQAEAKSRDLDASGKREELVARLVASDSADATPPEDAEAAEASVNGGIAQDVERTGTHAGSLQSLSAARRAAQLKAVSG